MNCTPNSLRWWRDVIRVYVDQLQLYKCCHGNDVSDVPMGCGDCSVETQTWNIIIRPQSRCHNCNQGAPVCRGRFI